MKNKSVHSCRFDHHAKFHCIMTTLNKRFKIEFERGELEKSFYYLFVNSTNCSGFRHYCCGFSKIAYFWSDFERYSVLGICLWNPKQRRRSKRNSKVADSATNLILVCCGIRLQCTECAVWPRNETLCLCNIGVFLLSFSNYK